MKGEKMQVRCPDCGRNAAALSPSRLAGHTDYRNSVRGPFPKCAQKTDPTAAIAAAKRAAERGLLDRTAREALRYAESCERRYLEEKRYHDNAQAKLAAAREALAAFDREHPPVKTNDETDGDVRAMATFRHTGGAS